MILTYTTPRTVAKIAIADSHDWATVGDYVAKQMGLKVAKNDAVYDEIMLARQYEKAKANKKGKK